MCYSVSYLEKKAEKLIERYKHVLPLNYRPVTISAELNSFYFVSGFEHPILPVVTNKGLASMQWGLIPGFCKDFNAAKVMQHKTLNAVGETLKAKPSFKNLLDTNRCIVPISGFFEWQHHGKNKIPFFIKHAKDDFLSAAGLYNIWENKENKELLYTFTIITTTANTLMEKIHNTKKRMPFFLTHDGESKWLNSELKFDEVAHLIKSIPEEILYAYTIGDLISNPKINRNRPEVLNESKIINGLFD